MRWFANRTHAAYWCRAHVLSSLTATLVCGGSISISTAAVARPPFTVADAIETSRFQEDRKGQSVFPSPDGLRYVSFVIRGDIKNDGIWLAVLSGGLTSLDSATPKLVSKHFTSGLPAAGPSVDSTGGPSALIGPGVNIPVWVGNEEIAYLWTDDRGHNQVFSLNVVSGRLNQLTHEELDVVAFTAHPNGELAYDTKMPYLDKSRDMFHSGFAVKSPDISTLLSGTVDGTSLYDLEMCGRSVSIKSHGKYVKDSVANSQIKCELSELIQSPRLISPDGRRLIINRHVKQVPAEWSAYRGHFGKLLRDAEQNPAGGAATMLSEIVIVDMARRTYHALWAAPAGLNPWSFVAWSPNSKRVLVAPTMLPLGETDSAAIEGDAVAIVDAETGQYQRVPMDPQTAASIGMIEWPTEQQIVLTLRDGRSIGFNQKNGGWTAAASVHGTVDKQLFGAENQKIRVTVSQALEQPPELKGIEVRTGRSRVLFDPNPNLGVNFALGHVEMIRWGDSTGLPWEGRLYYPAHYRPGVRYPLVIQTHGYAGMNEFSIYGQGNPGGGVSLGPGWSVYLAQPLASRDIAVLQIGGPEKSATREETDFERTTSRARALADAASHLVDLGLVDKDKVGIMGHSLTGRVIEAALALTDFPYAAAIAADCYELNYTQSMYLGWNVIEGMPPPFGSGLEEWLDSSPAFNIERIQTPLQLELTTGAGQTSTLVYPWEMFSRLRYLKKPVEYYVLPDIAHGSHLVQNPRQLLALQNRALDWWLFWLASEEDPVGAKQLQYQDWRSLRTMHVEDLNRSKPPVRAWKSTPTK